VANANKSTEPVLPELADLKKLIERAQRGDETSLPALRRMLLDPTAVDKFGGDLAEQAEISFVRAAAGDNLLFRESLTRKLELLRAELAGPNPMPLERLLVERIVACWLQLQDADIRYAQAKDLGLKWGAYYQDRMDRAHRRYLSAIKTLAMVRKLAAPVVQVNIAKKQINVAGAVPTRADGLDEH
jgi:hypothetical protein